MVVPTKAFLKFQISNEKLRMKNDADRQFFIFHLKFEI